jgi:hypothetical protein
MLVSCGGGGSSDKTNADKNPATPKSPTTSPGARSSSGGTGSTGSGASNYTRKLPAKVRVVNMYSRSGTGGR